GRQRTLATLPQRLRRPGQRRHAQGVPPDRQLRSESPLASRPSVANTLIVGLVLRFLVLVVEHSPQKSDAGADRGAHSGIAGDRAERRASGGAHHHPAPRSPLRIAHAGASSECEGQHYHCGRVSCPHATSLSVHFGGHGNSLMKKRPTNSTAGSDWYRELLFAHWTKRCTASLRDG